MKKKTINLSVWMFFQTVPAMLFLVYYGLCTWNGYHPMIRYLHAICLILAGALVWGQMTYAKKHCLFDEFARENLKTANSICLNFAYILMVIAALACVFADFNGVVAGYFVVGGIFVLAILRAVIFAVIDRKGL